MYKGNNINPTAGIGVTKVSIFISDSVYQNYSNLVHMYILRIFTSVYDMFQCDCNSL